MSLTVPPERPNHNYKVIVIGDASVGKTTLTYRLCENKFLKTTESTIGVDFRSKKIQVDGEIVNLQLWDTAGEERFRNSMVGHYYRKTHAIVLVYSISNKASFTNIQNWLNECETHSLDNVLKVLIGTKCDEPRAVSTQEAQMFADSYNMPLFETSAKLDDEYGHIDAIFNTLALKLKNQKHFMTDSTKGLVLGASVTDKTKQQSSCSC